MPTVTDSLFLNMMTIQFHYFQVVDLELGNAGPIVSHSNTSTQLEQNYKKNKHIAGTSGDNCEG